MSSTRGYNKGSVSMSMGGCVAPQCSDLPSPPLTAKTSNSFAKMKVGQQVSTGTSLGSMLPEMHVEAKVVHGANVVLRCLLAEASTASQEVSMSV